MFSFNSSLNIMISMKQFFVLFVTIQCIQSVASKPIFKGLSFKKNYEMEISAIPFKHISFIKEKWFPFKMIGVKHDIAKREVVEDPKDDNMYSVNEVTFDDEENGKFPGLLTSVKHNLDLNSDGEVIQNVAPVVQKVDNIHIKPVFETGNVAAGIVHASPVIPINPSLVFAPSIHTMGTAVQPSAVVPIEAVVANSVPVQLETQPPAPTVEVTPIQPIHTHIDVPSVEKLEESVSKMHTDISSAVPLNTLVASPVQEMDLPLPVDVKDETPIVVPPKVVEEIKVEPVAEPPSVITPIVDSPSIVPVAEPPIVVSGSEVVPGKTGPAGLLMRGTRFVLYFGSVMLQLLSQMISHNPISLNQITEPLALK